MADSLGKKLKGLFTMCKNKEEKAGIAADTGFEVLNDAPTVDTDENAGALSTSRGVKDETLTETPAAPNGEEIAASENIEDEAPETEPKTEKTHERVSQIAAEMNTKGYGL